MDLAFWQGKKVFLTGHTGFKGAWMCAVLEYLGAEVTGYALPPLTKPSLFEILDIENKVTHIEGDICDRSYFAAKLKESSPDVVVHMAAQSLVRKSYKEPVETFDVNVIGTLNLLEAVRSVGSVKSMVIVTTDKCYRNDDTGILFTESDPLGGKDPYSASKACAELVSTSYYESFFKQTDTAVATVRAGNVIGGGDWAEDRLIPDVVRAKQKNEAVLIRNPLSTRPWQHVLEPVCGYLLLAEKLFKQGHDYAGGWNFGPNPDDIKPVGEVLAVLQKSMFFNIEQDKTAQPHEAKTLGLDISKIKKLTGWQPKLSLSEALKWTGEWYQTYLDSGDLNQVTHTQIQEYLER